MKTENEFFKAKRPWPKIKDQVIRSYLVGVVLLELPRRFIIKDIQHLMEPRKD